MSENTVIRTTSRDRCLFCCKIGTIVHTNIRDKVFSVPGEWNTRKCERCGLLWIDPAPLTEDLHLAYQTYYTHQNQSTARLSFRELALRPIKSLLCRTTPLYQQISAYNGLYLDDTEPGRMLEIGCGNGTFLLRAKSRGWNVQGLDFDPEAVRQARSRGIRVEVGELTQDRFAENSFDAIVMQHVVEHLSDPIEVLSVCRTILSPGGKLVIVTPNPDSLAHSMYQEHWRGLEPPRHLYMFTASALRTLAARSGFLDIDAWTTFANAYIIFVASIEIAERGAHTMGAMPNVATDLRALWLQYRELFLHRTNPNAGEESVLIAVKQT